MMKQELDYQKMVNNIQDILEENDAFLFDMEAKLLPKKRKYTQQDAKKMESIITRIYMIAHCVHCTSCAEKYQLNHLTRSK